MGVIREREREREEKKASKGDCSVHVAFPAAVFLRYFYYCCC
jgi:hypothetical protein